MLLIWHICLEVPGFTTIDVSNFDMQNVSTTWGMFYMCHTVVTVNLGNFNAVKNESTRSMFCGCSSLQNWICTNFETGNVNNMRIYVL